jgi:glycerol-1-phosphate dehydrogenase [NAD(P)+]
MTTIWHLPRIELLDLSKYREQRPVALLTGKRSWQAVNTMVRLPVVVQAEPESLDRDYLDDLVSGMPKQVAVLYAIGGGVVADAAKYMAYKAKLPVVIVPTALSVDGFFTGIASLRESSGAGFYVETGPAEKVLIDWDVVSAAPKHLRGAAIVELLSITTGILDWRYAADRGKNAPDERLQEWALRLAAGIGQRSYAIAAGIGDGKVVALRELLDLICMEVRLTTQLGHTRPQEGSEQYFAQAMQARLSRRGRVAYAELLGPGILLAMAMHNQDAKNIATVRQVLENAGVRLNQLEQQDILETLVGLPEFVKKNKLPYSIMHDTKLDADAARALMQKAGL